MLIVLILNIDDNQNDDTFLIVIQNSSLFFFQNNSVSFLRISECSGLLSRVGDGCGPKFVDTTWQEAGQWTLCCIAPCSFALHMRHNTTRQPARSWRAKLDVTCCLLPPDQTRKQSLLFVYLRRQQHQHQKKRADDMSLIVISNSLPLPLLRLFLLSFDNFFCDHSWIVLFWASSLLIFLLLLLLLLRTQLAISLDRAVYPAFTISVMC